MSDSELERLRRRRLAQYFERLNSSKEEKKEEVSKQDLLNQIFIGRAWEVFNATRAQYPQVANKLSDVIDQFMEKHGKKLRKNFVNSQGKLESHVVILVNGRNYLFLEELNTKLKDGDIIVISPPLVGG